MYATWRLPVLWLKPAYCKMSGSSVKSHSIFSFWDWFSLLHWTSLPVRKYPLPSLWPPLAPTQHTLLPPLLPHSWQRWGACRIKCQLLLLCFPTSHRRVPFQRISSMILSSELQSNGGDTEPRGIVVKGLGSRTQGEGREGREKQHFDLHWSWTLRACLTPQRGAGLAVWKMMGKVFLFPAFITFLTTSTTSPSGSYTTACSRCIRASFMSENKSYIHQAYIKSFPAIQKSAFNKTTFNYII